MGHSRNILLIKKDIVYKRRKDLENNINSMIWIEVTLERSSILVMGAYRQFTIPQKIRKKVTDKKENPDYRFNLILEMIMKALKENKEVMIMMDTNIDTSTNRVRDIHTPSRMKRNFEEFLEKKSLCILNEEFTRFESGKEPTCIDHIVTNAPKRMQKVQ